MKQQIDTKQDEVTAIISRFIAETQYDQIPPQVVDRIKKSILDTIGIIIPATQLMPELKPPIDLFLDAGGKEESTVFAYGRKLPSWAATFANGIRGHALDYADGHLEAVFRVGISVIPAALALAEKKGKVSGKELITAVGVAEEVLCRLGIAVARRRSVKRLGPWHAGILMGNFGAAAAAARMLDLDADKTERALGIAYLQTGGTEVVVAPDCNIRGMYAGFVGKTGVIAALLSEKGLLGPRGCLGHPDGLFNVYLNNAYDRDALVENLGSEYELIDLSFKPWPACALAHTYIDAMLGLRAEHNLRVEDIDKIEVFSGEMSKGLCLPINLAEGKIPQTTNDAKRSIPFNVAVAALKGNVQFQDFTQDGMRDPEVLKIAEKVVLVMEPEFDDESILAKGNGLPPGKIAVTTKQGQVLTKQTDFPYGHHHNPIKAGDIIEKFKDCLEFSPKPMSPGNRDLVIEKILNLEEVADVREIIELLA